MELPVALQLRELALALAFGALFGLLYDALRPFRRSRHATALLDLIYCLLVLLGLLFFALYAGRGRLRLFALAAIAVSGGLWLWLVSPILRRVQQKIERSLRKAVDSFLKYEKKCKKAIAFAEKSDTIDKKAEKDCSHAAAERRRSKCG